MYALGRCRPATAALLAIAIVPAAWADAADDLYAAAVEHYTYGRWSAAESGLAQFLTEHPQDAEAASALFLLAESRIQQRNYRAARAGFLEYLAQHPEHRYARQALFRAGEAAFLSQGYDEAGPDFSRFREQYPEDALNGYVLGYLGEMALAARRVVEAQSLFRENLRRYPAGPLSDESRWGLGRVLEFQGDVDAARQEYRLLVRDGGPLADKAQVQLGISYYSRGRYDDAAAEFQQAVADFADSPLLPHARYWLGMSRLAQGRWSDARRILEDAIADHGDDPLIPAMTHWLAEAHRHDGDPDAASGCYKRVWGQWPESEWADDSLAAEIEIALAGGRFDRVEELASRFAIAYADSPLHGRVQQAAGRALLKCERFADAVAVLESSLQVGPGAQDADQPPAVPIRTAEEAAARQAGWYYLALAYLGGDRPDAALTALDQIDWQTAGSDLQLGLQVARATALVAQQRYEQAIPLLEAFLAEQPQGPEATQCRLQLVVALARSGQWDRAIELQEQLAAAAPQHPAVWRAANEIAEAAYDAEEYELAAARFGNLIAADIPPEYAAKGRSGLGWSHHQMGDSAAAAEHFERLCTAFPESKLAIEGAMMRAKCLEQLGRAAAAVEVYLGLIALHPKSEQESAALFEAARLQEMLDQRPAALSLLDRLVEQHPEFPRIDAAHYQRAWLLLEFERSAEAEAAFQRLSDDHPGSRYWSDATYRLAERAARSQQRDRAETLVGKLLGSEHTSDEIRGYALYLQGQLAASAERWQHVAAPLEQLLEQFPQSSLRLPAEYWIAESHFRQQDTPRAAEAFARLSRRIGNSSEAWLGMIPLRQSQILLQQEQWSEAAETADTIAARFPGFRQQYEAEYVIGRCLARQGKFSQARESYERVIRSPEGGKTETAAMAQWMIGETYLHQQDYAQAIRAFQQVDDLFAYPRWQAAALLQAGKSFELNNEPGEASRVFKRLLENHPQSAFAQEAALCLRRLSPPASDTARSQDPLR